ncbi:uncharacterized protein LOC110055093 [Orbicella faveolata]|uniref:uncharacterized protein LOC110055093 n=1 Tax=Orbicella faveolata TaxID=48498 RepID=UPI0009E31A26|nr:uncharacterized protein LOC110055093 [Orbicella faveolata]XP_020617131.1 uncharacterized protein LOC110055093 [Orbicella faveolata]XP_020617132.1 uncharacterized protein LOC110055093 [Orbicella faveolata]
MICPQRIKSTRILTMIFLGFIIFYANLYLLKIKCVTTKGAPKTKFKSKGQEKDSIPLKPRHRETIAVVQGKNFAATENPPKDTTASDLAFKSKRFENRKTSCARRIREIDGGIVLLRNVTIRAGLSHAKVLEMHLKRPTEKDEYFKLEKGFFTLYCDGDVNEARKKLQTAEAYYVLSHWIIAFQFAHPSLSPHRRSKQSFQTGQYLAIQRIEFASVYWTIIDLLDIFITTQRMGIEPEKLNIVLIDAHPATPLDPFWSVLFQRLIKLGTDDIFKYSNDVMFENLAWRYPRDNCPLLDKNVKSLKYIQPFRSFVLKRFGIPSEVRKRNCSQSHKLNVLVSFRRDYHSHPRKSRGTVDRKIANEEEVVNEMQSNFSSKLNITTAQLDLLPLKRQLELVASADIFFGMHGAAHAFPIFMAPGGAVIEMFNFRSGNWHMEKISSLSGHSHIIWTNTDENAYNTKTKSTTIPAGIPTMLLKEAIEKICE